MLANGYEGDPVSVSAITSKWRCNIPIQQIQGMTPVIGGKLYSLHAYPARSRHSGMSSDEPPDSLHVSLSNVTEPSREHQNRPNDRGDQRSAKMLPHCYQNPTAAAALSFTSFP